MRNLLNLLLCKCVPNDCSSGGSMRCALAGDNVEGWCRGEVGKKGIAREGANARIREGLVVPFEFVSSLSMKTLIRHGRVARQRVPATQSLARRKEARVEANRRGRVLYDRRSGISGWPVRAAARHGHDEF